MSQIFKFTTRNVVVSGRTKEGRYYEGQATLNWTMQLTAETWGIFSWGINLPDQELKISYSIYNEQTGDDEDKEEVVQIEGQSVDCKMIIKDGSQDFMPFKIDLNNKKIKVHFGTEE